MHVSESGCSLVLQRDLEYWVIDELMMEACCALKYYPQIDICQNEKDGDIKAKQKELELAELEDFGSSRWGTLRSFLWCTMEYPWSSKLAQFVGFFSLLMVLVSTLTFILSTFEELMPDDQGNVEYPTIVAIIKYIDTFVIIYFTFEYIIRLVCSPEKGKFLKAPMNVVDLVAVAPYYLSIILEELEDFKIIGKAGKIVRLVRVMRFLRIFKLVRHFAGLQSLFYTLQQAYKELGLLILLVIVAILTFSSLAYFAEKKTLSEMANCTESHTKQVDAIFLLDARARNPCYSWTFVESFWWGLMTLTTVGYELNPKTLLGKIIGGFCALSGIFILTLPIPIVVNSFASYYKNRLWRNEVAHKKSQVTRKQASEMKQMQKMFLINAMAAPLSTMAADASPGKVEGDGAANDSKMARTLGDAASDSKMARILGIQEDDYRQEDGEIEQVPDMIWMK